MMNKYDSKITISAAASSLKGTIRCPGDKSISHRALMIGGLAVGPTRIEGLLEAEDVLNTAKAMAALGVGIKQANSLDGLHIWTVDGRGVGGLIEPVTVLDLGNSGTGARLLLGLLASHSFSAVVTGDASLSRRPMERVTAPLTLMGASFESRQGGFMPITVRGADDPLAMVYHSPVASAQVKSAILLAGLNARGATTVIEPAPTRDHTETMLRHFGAEVVTQAVDGNPSASSVTVIGLPEMRGQTVIVPGDPSSAAFLVVAALITENSDITIQNVGLNPLRTGLYDTLADMGGDISIMNRRNVAGELVGDLRIRSSRLFGKVVPAARAPSMIDEYPILAVAAACAEGDTRMEGLSELKVKETDRLAAIVGGLSACGVEAAIDKDILTVKGQSGPVPGGAIVPVHLDHRIAMSFLVLGMVADKPIGVDDVDAITTSYPDFISHMDQLGASLTKVKTSDLGSFL
ncbi:MAG: 3-phosphoshikimate 1-carboxyvinyltransferase [Rhodospirillaceae bacterium]